MYLSLWYLHCGQAQVLNHLSKQFLSLTYLHRGQARVLTRQLVYVSEETVTYLPQSSE
jgi:hypothetical protein